MMTLTRGVAGVLAATLTIGLAAALPSAQAHEPQGPCVGPVLYTQGDSEMTVSPDAFRAEATLQVREKTTPEATAQANRIMASVKNQLQALNIPGLVLKTTQYNTYPIWPENNNGKRKPVAYQHTQTLQVQVEGVQDSAKLADAANKVLGVMSNTDSIEPGGLNWYLSSGAPYEAELLRKAVTKAKSRAVVMAEASGSHLGQVCELTYNPQMYYPQPMLMRAKAAGFADAAEAMPAPQVEAGEQKLTAQVQVRFLITP